MSKIADLCREDKQKVATLIQQVVKLGSERDAATTESESAAKSFEHKIEQLKYQNERLVRELVALRHKFSQSLEVLKAYQGRMLDMETQLKAQQENLDESSSRSRPALSVCQPVAIAAVRAVPFKRLPALSMAVEANVHVPPVTVAEPPSRDVFSASSSESQAFTSIMPQLPRAGGTAAEVERTLDAQRDEDNSDLLYSFVTESSDGDESREDAVLPSRAPLTRGADVWSSPPRPGAVMSAHQQWLSASEFERHQELLHSPSRSRSIDRSDTSEHRSSSGGSDDSDGDAAWSDPARLTSYMHARRQPTIEESEPLDPSEGSISLGAFQPSLFTLISDMETELDIRPSAARPQSQQWAHTRTAAQTSSSRAVRQPPVREPSPIFLADEDLADVLSWLDR